MKEKAILIHRKDMRTRLTAFTFIVSLITTTIFAEPGSSREATSSQQQTSAPKYALLVGVNVYKKDSGVSHLGGTHNDVALMKSLLVENGFQEDLKKPAITAAAPCGDQTATSAIKTLCSAQATKQAIVDAFDNHLVKNAEAYWKGRTPDPSNGPFIVFYYSGHGSQVPDKIALPGEEESQLIKDEADNLDETIVPHDTDKVGTRDIRDDFFKDRIDKVRKYTTNIMIMSDSCHSGTISRGGPGARQVERTFPNLGARGEGGEERDLPADNSYITISGSEPSQLSYEEPIEDDPVTKKPVMNGLLTYYFVRHARDYKGASYDEIMNLVRSSVFVHKNGVQTPQVEGDIDRAVFGTQPGSSRKRAISLKCTGSGSSSVCSEKITRSNPDKSTYTARKIKMDVGEIVGARVGGSVVVYAPNAKELTGDTDVLASGTITSADSFTSEAEVTPKDTKADSDLPPLAKVVLVTPNFTVAKRVVALDLKSDGDADPGLASMRRLSESLKKSAALMPVETNGLMAKFKERAPAAKDWKIAVVRSTYADFKEGMVKRAATKDVTYADTDTGYYISDTAGIPLYDLWIPANSDNADARILAVLDKHVHAENVRVLANEASKLKGKIKVEMVRYKNYVRGATPTPYTAAEQKAAVKGATRMPRSEAFHLNITNTYDKPLFLYIYSIDPSGAVDLLFPASGAHEEITPGVPFRSPGSNPRDVFFFAPDAPTGRETIKILVSESKVQAHLLTQAGVASGERGTDTALDKLLRSVGSNTRASSSVEHVSDWITYDVSYTVVP